jgi:hypothetical protein
MFSLKAIYSCWLVVVLGWIGPHDRRLVADAFTSNSLATTGINKQSTISSTQLWAGVPQLDKWKLLPNGSVVGTVMNHPSIDDGDVITTSPIMNADLAKSQAIVLTATGSQYKLMDPIRQPQRFNQPPREELANPPKSNNGFSFPSLRSTVPFGNGMMKQQNDNQAVWRDATKKYKLTKETVGLDGEYVLAGRSTRSTSGKSKIWEAYKADINNDGLPTGDPPVCIKISSNLEAVSREYENYKKISFLGIARGRFVKCVEFFPVAGYSVSFRSQCALVLEMGARDLKSYLNSRGSLEGSELRDAALSAAQCVQALHSAGLVWTDLKTENFVVMGNGEVKGIDLESAMPAGDNPVDYSPEACPPEFADAFLSGDGPYFQLDYSYDIWSLGMMMLELATGRGYFDGKNPAQITKILRDTNEPLDLNYVDCDPKLKDLISRCLQREPRKRPNLAQILLHPYFITGPLSLFRNW